MLYAKLIIRAFYSNATARPTLLSMFTNPVTSVDTLDTEATPSPFGGVFGLNDSIHFFP